MADNSGAGPSTRAEDDSGRKVRRVAKVKSLRIARGGSEPENVRDNDSGEPEPEGSGDEVEEGDQDSDEESLGSNDSEESYDSELGLHDFVVPDEEVENSQGSGGSSDHTEVVDRPDRGIEMAPPDNVEVKDFNIVRLIQFTNKAGNDAKCPIVLNANYFKVDYGDFLLRLNTYSSENIDRIHVRNYSGQERYIPRRMLQSVELPWSFLSDIELDDENGIGLPLAFVGEIIPADFGGGVDFDENEAVMIKANGNPTKVVDFEGRVGEIQMRQDKIKRLAQPEGGRKAFEEEEGEEQEEEDLLYAPFEFPWELRVNVEWLDQWNWLISNESKSSSQGSNTDKDKGKGTSDSTRKSEPRKRGHDDDEPKPKPKKRAKLTTVSKPKSASKPTSVLKPTSTSTPRPGTSDRDAISDKVKFVVEVGKRYNLRPRKAAPYTR
ncbi:uncharacterized protein LY89DRAFT_673959 [Mollisia scopiformis]|uniref:Uncharacterized protein n=1 Tax=Mollisia scopiformis TaxID=149040 RepID=A0A194WW37_MOLSC|nr:uncharacterized protein LY89DRAFT_673959 [Mollisia scopiformis]KUJ12178.1 hypothetical protein LY89DRAFT_673959 [Mollisia scopiformis]